MTPRPMHCGIHGLVYDGHKYTKCPRCHPPIIKKVADYWRIIHAGRMIASERTRRDAQRTLRRLREEGEGMNGFQNVRLFRRWECGCIGIPLDGTDAIILDACDTDREAPAESLSWAKRNMAQKAAEPLTPEWREQQLHARLAKRLAYADRFDAILNALGIRGDL